MDASALCLKPRRNVLELQLDDFEALEPGDDGAELDERFARREGRQWTPVGVRAFAGRHELVPRGPP